MEAVIGLLLMLLGVSHGVETSCDGRINGTQCYGALGGTVVLRLMNRASGIYRYKWVKNKTVILRGRNDKLKTNLLETRSSFTPSDGTFRISNLSRTDGGEYTLKIYDTSGRVLDPQILQLNIQAPVFSVLLVSECLSQGEMRVSCSSEGGDSPQYSWTLDGHTLTDAQLLSGNKDSNTITLRQDVSGQLVCSVSNNVNSVSQNKTISTCGFIFVDCISNGTHISQWVFEANNTLCVESTTACTSTTEDKESGTTVLTVPTKPPTAPTTITETEASTEGVETSCDGRINGTQCYGALGGTVVLRLMDRASGIHRYQWNKNKTVILRGRNDKLITNLLETRSSFTPSDGTFRINNLSRTDGGEYTLKIFETSGRVLDSQILQLNIQAPVSSVLLVPECLSQGEMRVSCSSEGGDSPQYSWTLDGHTLTDAQLLSGNKDRNTITLRQDVSGQLVCSVSNNVSRVSKDEMMSTCDQFLLILGLRAAVVILIFSGITVYFVWKKKKYEKAEGSAVPEEMNYENSVVMVEIRSSASEL
ncbi:uncharacterized protein LOC119008150 isoform X2 [Acanthopagrus latus]|uniref:uncharacterized protein LOC119008150 isoform X2 n=1 Tax=Acanthopagrus latus TaxID=8177 RepID=UPI00187BF557|nr:uncharacterized protein LOC119008150 isoform X2 [Acanthopagrus latus]